MNADLVRKIVYRGFIMSYTLSIYGYVSLRGSIKDLFNLDLIICFTTFSQHF